MAPGTVFGIDKVTVEHIITSLASTSDCGTKTFSYLDCHFPQTWLAAVKLSPDAFRADSIPQSLFSDIFHEKCHEKKISPFDSTRNGP